MGKSGEVCAGLGVWRGMLWNKERNGERIKDRDMHTDREGDTDAENHKDMDTKLTRQGIGKETETKNRGKMMRSLVRVSGQYIT